jgi:hypothetical protein
VLLSTDVIWDLQSRRLRAPGAFSEVDFELFIDEGEALAIPSVMGFNDRLDAVLPFGEYYGLFVPAGAAKRSLGGLDAVIKASVASEDFKAFARERGLSAEMHGRAQSDREIERYGAIVCWTLFETGYLTVNPGELGFARPGR